MSDARLPTPNAATNDLTQALVIRLRGIFQRLLPNSLRIGGTDSPRILYGTGTPEAKIIGSVGDSYYRTDGGASTTLYVKESGAATNTGWIAK